ncbi:hypothetical protein M0E87_07495 [Corynebacterium sp. CCM 9185]|uniref:EcsC family protein n=1 Tax=Corynebacterium marambiense TaxID=2765364 RepID=A0ABS0VTP7_9CORY|nr:hypothetical protein [Corynebacterium marambiense]MBI9000150.1 hypothetical protein [Corynebacterium marambiense]MCK7663504.1 hypothetical protein [Corynebacterium marambiense]
MGLFDGLFGDDNNDKRNDPPITDAVGSDPKALEGRTGATGRMLISGLDKAVHIQAGTIAKYVDWMRAKNPELSPRELQKAIDQHFSVLATGSGGAAGIAAAVPGIGLITGAAAIGVESLVFLDLAAFYTMASAKLRDVDIHDPERRRALILVALTGSSGTAIVDAAVGDLSAGVGSRSIATTLSSFSGAKLTSVNNRMVNVAVKTMGKKFRRAWLGKIMPLGIGAIVGSYTNHRLADKVVSNVGESLGGLPAEFSTPVPKDVPEDIDVPAEIARDVAEANVDSDGDK